MKLQTERELDLLIGKLLRLGVVIATTVGVLGAAVFFAGHGGEPSSAYAARGGMPELRSVAGVLRAAAELRGPALMQLGVLLLVATPIARVALALVGFAKQRDGLYVGISALVLAVLAFSLMTGIG